MSFDTSIAKLKQIEGGFVDDPLDSGGATNFGITERLARAYGYGGDMRELPYATAVAIYRSHFWDRLLLPQVEQLSERIADELFDTEINCMAGFAVRSLQRSLNVLNLNGSMFKDIAADGQMGPMTLASLREYLRVRGPRGERVLMRALNGWQRVYYMELAERREKDERFVFGWLDHRTED